MSKDSSSLLQPSVVLTRLEAAPRSLTLKHAICLPCRTVGSRCEGHARYTEACLQCRQRGIECKWRLAGDTDDRKRRRRRHKVTTSDSDGDRRDIDISEESTKRKQSRSLSLAALENYNGLGKLPVPSAGWPSKRKKINAGATSSTHETNNKTKGKEKAALSSSDESERKGEISAISLYGSDTYTGEHKETAARDLASESEREDIQTYLARLSSTATGNRFLGPSSYASLLSSMFAESSSDLSRSLYWWETSVFAARKRSRWPPLPTIEPQQWRAMSYGHRLLSENVYTWTLWPRQSKPTDLASKINTIPVPDLPEEIAALVLHYLTRSSIAQSVVESLTPTQMQVLLQGKMNDTVPFALRQATHRQSPFAKSTYAIPLMSETEYRAKYLEPQEMTLDHAEEVQGTIVLHTTHAINSVLLKLAEMRRPYGMRRHIPVMRISKAEKGKQRVFEGEQQGKEEMQHDEETDPQKGRSRTRTKAQAPGDWKSILLAAVCVRGMPRRFVGSLQQLGRAHRFICASSAIEETIKRVEAIYGSAGIDCRLYYPPTS